MPHKIGADAWFDRRKAEKYEVQEQTVHSEEDEVLTLILINDARMLEHLVRLQMESFEGGQDALDS